MGIIGITGLSGSGKSTVAKKFEKLGYIHVDIDKEIHKIIEENSDEIAHRFGTSNRENLRSLIFMGKIDKEEYTDFIMSSLYASLKLPENCVIDYAFLPLTPYWEKCDIKILCQASYAHRKIRVTSRDEISGDLFDRREANAINLLKYNSSEIDIVIGES